MAGLTDVWVCAEDLELVRADRIVSVYADTGNSTYRSSAVPAAASWDAQLYLYALLAVGQGDTAESTVILGRCPGHEVVPWMASLTCALAEAAQLDTGQPVIVRPTLGDDRKPGWECSSGLPDGWPDPPHGARRNPP